MSGFKPLAAGSSSAQSTHTERVTGSKIISVGGEYYCDTGSAMNGELVLTPENDAFKESIVISDSNSSIINSNSIVVDFDLYNYPVGYVRDRDGASVGGLPVGQFNMVNTDDSYKLYFDDVAGVWRFKDMNTGLEGDI